MTKAIDRQIGGDHYKKLKIQPMEYSLANNLNAAQHTVVKYVTRYKDKGGLQDLEKALHTLEMLIEHETSQAKQDQPELPLREFRPDGSKVRRSIDDATPEEWNASIYHGYGGTG